MKPVTCTLEIKYGCTLEISIATLKTSIAGSEMKPV